MTVKKSDAYEQADVFYSTKPIITITFFITPRTLVHYYYCSPRMPRAGPGSGVIQYPPPPSFDFLEDGIRKKFLTLGPNTPHTTASGTGALLSGARHHTLHRLASSGTFWLVYSISC